jgi:carbon monoxide dehydrogenase subunit G
MKFEGKIRVKVPPAEAWDFLTDVNKFSRCMPGLENVTQIDERTFDGIIGAKVGPISGNFSFRSTIVEGKPPEQMIVRIEGTDSVTKSGLNAKVTAVLKQPVENETELSYQAEVEIKGRLAILGDMVIRTTAALVLDEFTKRLRTQLERDASG